MPGHARQLKSARCRLAAWIEYLPVRPRLWAIRLITTLRRPAVAVGGWARCAQRERNSYVPPRRHVTSSGYRPRAIGESFTDFRLMLSISLKQPWRPADPFIGQGPVWLPGRDAPAAHDARRSSICVKRRGSSATFTASAGAPIGRPGFSQPRVSGLGAAFSIGGCLPFGGSEAPLPPV
jgi:hypothetical protein